MQSDEGSARGIWTENRQIIQIKRKRKDPPVDSIVLDQGGTEDISQHEAGQNGVGKQAGSARRKIRRTFMYQRISGATDNIALFDTTNTESLQQQAQVQKQDDSAVQHPAYGLPALPPPVFVPSHHQSSLKDNDFPDGDVQIPRGTGDLPRDLMEKLIDPVKQRSQGESQKSKQRARNWVVVQAPGVGPDGERRFVVEKKDVDMTDAPMIVKDIDMADAAGKGVGIVEDEYVWDILVRTTVPDLASAMPGAFPATNTLLFGPNSGRLILNEDDADERELFEELYQSDDDDVDEKVETDEEDENAEGYYGADYPDEEDDDDDEDDDDEDDEDDPDRYYGSDDEDGNGAGYYNEATGRFSRTRYLNTYNDEVQSWARSH